MKTSFFGFAVLGILGVSPSIGSASIISTVDTFDITQQIVVNPNSAPCGGSNSSTAAAPEAVGGQRTIQVSGNVNGCSFADTNITEAGVFSTSSPGITTGLFSIIWNNALDADSLTGFTIRARQDADSQPSESSSVFFRVCTVADGSSGCTNSSAASIAATTYSDYWVTFGRVLNDISYIRMTIASGAGRDIAVDHVNASVDVPEPSTIALAFCALLALGFRRTRSLP